MAGKKISQLSSSLAPSLTSVLPIVYSGVTYQTTLQSLRNVLVDNGSHTFIGNQVINGSLFTSGSVTGSYFVGDGSRLTNLPQQTTDVSMFLSSSTFASASASFNQRIALATNEQDISGFATTSSLNNLNQVVNNLINETGSYLKTLPAGLVSGSIQISYTGLTDTPDPTDVSMFLSSSVFDTESGSFHNRIEDLVSQTSSYITEIPVPTYISSGPTSPGSAVSATEDAVYIAFSEANDYSFSRLGFTFPDNTMQTTAYTGLTEGIISGSQQVVDLGFATTGSNTFYGNQIINGSLTIEGVSEVITADGGFGGNKSFNYDSGSIFYLTGLTSNGVWNVNNVPDVNNRTITLTFVINQGATAYSGSQYQINGSNVTVKWVNNTVPSGSSNNVDIVGLTAFRVASTWNVIGSITTFGQ